VAMHFCAWAVDDKYCLVANEARHDQKICHSCEHALPTPVPTEAPAVPELAPARLIKVTVLTDPPTPEVPTIPAAQLFPATIVAGLVPPPSATTSAPTIETIEPETAEEPTKVSDVISDLEARLKEIEERIVNIEDELADEKAAAASTEAPEEEQQDGHHDVKAIHAHIVNNIKESKEAIQALLKEIKGLKDRTEEEEGQQQPHVAVSGVVVSAHFTANGQSTAPATLLSATEKARLMAPVSQAKDGHIEPAYADNV